MTKILVLGLLLVASSLQAAPQATEIAFTRSCAKGVPVYDSAKQAVSCSGLKAGGSGYVLEMASAAGARTDCPAGFSFIGMMNKNSLGSAGGMQYFACAKN